MSAEREAAVDDLLELIAEMVVNDYLAEGRATLPQSAPVREDAQRAHRLNETSISNHNP